MSELPKAYLSRRYWFSASHRLHSPAFTEEQNRELYGKCNNPFGHGHNYALEITISGFVDPRWGMVANLVDLDGVVSSEVLERFDHSDLNRQSGPFGEAVPTTENLCIAIYDLLERRWPAENGLAGTRLERVRLEETRNNTFEYGPGVEGPGVENAKNEVTRTRG